MIAACCMELLDHGLCSPVTYFKSTTPVEKLCFTTFVSSLAARMDTSRADS